MAKLIFYFAVLFSAMLGSIVHAATTVEVHQEPGVVTLSNDRIILRYDLKSGTWSAADVKEPRAVIARAATTANQFSSTVNGAVRTCVIESLNDALGAGRSVLITTDIPQGPKLLLRISLYGDRSLVALSAGLENTTDQVIQLKEFSPLDGVAYRGFDTTVNYSTLDGFGGGEKTFISHEGRKRVSRNNLLATFGKAGGRRSLVMGGLTYDEFEKYASVERSADDSLAVRVYAQDPVGKRIDPGMRYLPTDRFYLDFSTANPFDALESYAHALRLAQGIVLNVCRFPIVDTWFAQVPHFGGGEDRAGYRCEMTRPAPWKKWNVPPVADF